MRFNRRSLWLSTVALFSAATIFAACTDRDGDSPLGPETPVTPAPPHEIARVECSASIAARTLTCRTPGASAGSASGDAVFLGDQGVNVRMISSNIVIEDDSFFVFDAAIQNLIPQKIGTTDGISPDSVDDLLVFFNTGPNVTAANGAPAAVSVANPDGTGIFLRTDQKYFAYPNEVLDSGEVSATRQWKIKFTPTVQTFSFIVVVSAPVQFPSGWIDVTPKNLVLAPTKKDTLVGIPRSYSGARTGQAVSWASSKPDSVSVVALDDTLAEVTAIAKGTVTITATAGSTQSFPGTRTGTATVVVNSPVTPQADSAGAIGNRTLKIPAPGVLANDTDADGGTLSIVPETVTTFKNGSATLAADGSFTYLSASGVSGLDSITYRVTDGIDTASAKVVIKMDRVVWYVDNSKTATAPGNGTDARPFTALKSAADSATSGEEILVFRGLGTTAGYDQGIALDAGEVLTGQGIASPVVVTLNGRPDTLLAPLSAPFITRNTAGPTVLLGGNNTVQGFSIASSNGAAIQGSGFGTLTMSALTIAANGPGLDLQNGSVAPYTFAGFSSTGSAGEGVRLVNVTMTGPGFLQMPAGSTVSNATRAAFLVSGGDVDVYYEGSVTQSADSAIVTVLNNHTGQLFFATGFKQAVGGSKGFEFVGASGQYTFNGTTQLENLDSAVVVRSSTGQITFSGDASVVNTSAVGVYVNGSTPNLAFNGNVGTNAGRPVVVEGMTAGSHAVQFSGTVVANGAAQGLLVQNNAGGTVRFNGSSKSITVGGTERGVVLTNNAGATIEFIGGGLVITTDDGNGLDANNAGTLLVRGSGNKVTSTGGIPVQVTGGTTIDSQGLSFAEINATGGTHGVNLNNTVGGNAILISGGTIQNTTGHGIRLNSTGLADLRGVTINNAASGGNAGVWASSAALTGDSSAVISITGGPALELATITLSGSLRSVSSTNSPTTGISLTTANGGIGLGVGTLQNATGADFNVSGFNSGALRYHGAISSNAGRSVSITGMSAGTLTFTGNLTDTGTGVLVQNNTGGTIAFNGASKQLTMTGANKAVTLTNNDGGKVEFGGGGLVIVTATGNGFEATAGGTVEVRGAGNRINSTGGIALNVQDTDIASLGLTWERISATGGTNGIFLKNTGATGGVQVNGTGTASSGGIIQNTTGGDGTTAGVGVYLENTRNIELNWMQLNDHQGHGIRGVGVVGFTMNKTRITGTNGTNDAFDEGGMSFTQLTGSASITGSRIEGGFEDNVRVFNSSGTLNRITFNFDTIGVNGTANGSDGMLLEPSGSAVMNVTITNTRFLGAKGDLIQTNTLTGATMDLIFQNNVISNAHPSIVAAGGGTTFSAGGTFTFNMSGNTFRDAVGTAVFLNSAAGGVVRGRFENNTIGAAGVANSGSTSAHGLLVESNSGGDLRVVVNNNTIREHNNHGLWLNLGDQLGNPATIDLTVTNNTVTSPGTLTAATNDFNGFQLNAGRVMTDNFSMCLDLQDNSFAGGGHGDSSPNNRDFRFRQRQATTVRLPGYAGASNDDAAVVSFLQSAAQNNNTGTGAASNTVSTGGGGYVGGAACAQP